MLGHHDRDRFEVIGYHLRPVDGGDCCADIEAAVDWVVDVPALSDMEAADRIHDDGIDVLVDIDGYTSRNRVGIFALRAAPLQACWLGFPGTLGAGWFDYIIADKVVVPPGADRHYAKAVVRLSDIRPTTIATYGSRPACAGPTMVCQMT